MDAVFDAQYRNIKDAFALEGIHLEVAYTAAGDVDYVYQAGRLLTLFDGPFFGRLQEWLPGIQRVDDEEPVPGALTVLSIENLRDGYLTVPQALDIVDERLGDANPGPRGGKPVATPDYLHHITRLCPPIPPEVPGGDPRQPYPPPVPPDPPAPPGPAAERRHRRGAFIGVSDTGHLDDLDPSRYPWLDGVDGDPDELGPRLPSGLFSIPEFNGHGTFVAGVAKTMAPHARVFVARHFSRSGAQLESELVGDLEALAGRSPDIINISAGTYTRRDWTSLGFELFHERHPDATLVASAGNDGIDRPVFPAAYDWAISVGALGADQRNRAWFSDFGPWVDVYALGEGLVNAYAAGEYTYQEPPKRPARQRFSGMARWDGTSFAAALVTGLIAARMARTGLSSAEAARDLIETAERIPGVGRVLHPSDGR
jgi:hypothetical protein